MSSKIEIIMMTREEVAEILHYCKTKGITRKERLKELGIAPWKFYEYKAKYAAEEMSGSTEGTFLQLAGSSEIVPMPSFAAKCGKKSKCKSNQLSSKTISIELRTSTGTMMRISGEMECRTISETKKICQSYFLLIGSIADKCKTRP